MQIFFHQLHVIADPVANESQNDHPDSSAEGGVECELGEVHPGEPRGETDELPDHRDQAPHKGGDLPMIFKEFLALLHLLLRDEEVLAVLDNKGPARVDRDVIINKRANQAADDAGKDNEE